MLFISDIHGELAGYLRVIEGAEQSLQLGDFGYGFVEVPPIPGNHRFIRGNHDNPALCAISPNYMGDYGYDKSTGIFYVSGAWSIDKAFRTPGIDWWEDEELSYSTLLEMIELYAKTKPEIMATHECPARILHMLHSHHAEASRTALALDACFNEFQPKTWLFGHHHVDFDRYKGNTRFICMRPLGSIEI